MRTALIISFAFFLSPPVAAEIIPINEGDVYCVSYEAASNSCASVQTLKDMGNGRYLLLDLSGFAFGATNLDMTSTLEVEGRDGLICVVEDGVKISVTPKSSKLAEGWQNLMQYQLDEMVTKGHCFEHKPCGENWVAIAHFGGKKRQDMSLTFRIFPADDPRSDTVQPRYLGEAELSTMHKRVSDECFGEDT